MVSGFMLIDKSTKQVRSIQGALMFDTPHNAKKALKKDCKRCGENYEDTLEQYDIVDFIATEFAAGVLINNERYSLHKMKLSKKDIKALSNGETLMYNNHDIKNLITLEVEND
ncbi:hypothetical protein [Streptococcus orisratti]|uniref:hypothetical protein n=1 Tax=Streptococcus orisratti TaxID=114652 RepID=UPI002942443F|nr:hypothetical protein [Streptococcus orisratti]